ncbi:protein kinase domain-containing protein [Theileria equi strain WA]|uniref:Protein kinase domain-containing protein n=1 Tax=Theileria equi strain WA TaxID=1537102 RepID=L0B2H9_THEEQ|nr:protein kinase domain-containing protein [Theileria equi strain WA]AFZ81416.1 protein kinase domain-containing protein [Theileria equi strain WA]|eukprot:XP_004831082.1 protein kinase domain-containing protein [Theileria equi strain WA]
MGGNSSKEYKNRNKYTKECLKKFDPYELAVLQKIFKELANRSISNGIDKGTFLQYFNLPGLWGEQLFRKFDINDSGFVELDEFLTGIAITCRGTRSEKIYVLFKILDLNNDDYIQKSELVTMLSNFPSLISFLSKPSESDELYFRGGEHDKNMDIDRTFLNTNEQLRELGANCNLDKPKDMFNKRAEFNPNINPNCLNDQQHSIPMHNIAFSLSKCSFPSSTSNQSVIKSIEMIYRNQNTFSRFNSTETFNAATDFTKIRNYVRTLSDNPVTYRERNGKHTLQQSECDASHLNTSSHLNSSLGQNSTKSCNELKRGYGSKPKMKMKTPEERAREKYEFYTRSRSESPCTPTSLRRSSSSISIKASKNNISSNASSYDSWSDSDSAENIVYDNKNILKLDDPALILVKSIIDDNDEQENLEHSNLNLDILVEQIFEECDFNESGHLSFLKFKAWLEKNDSILTMFSQFLHEEVWGLQGNAFFRNEYITDSSPILRDVSKFEIMPNDQKSTSKGSSRKDELDDITKRTIYRMFLVKGKHAFNFTSQGHNSEGLVSEELVEHMKAINTNLTSRFTSETNVSTPNESQDNLNRTVYELYSCPNCKTPFLMCPVCYKRYRGLSLHIESSSIYIKCSNCHNSDNDIFETCWICNWEFKEIFLNEFFRKASQLGSNNIVRNSSIATLSSPDSSTPKNGSEMTTSRSVLTHGRLLSNSIEPGHINISKPTKSGIMYKIGKTLHQWRTRYYVLIGNILYYYRDKSSTRPKGCIFLEGCYLDSLRKRQIGNKFGFCICYKGNKFSKRDFYVDSMEQFLEWIDVLSQAMKQQSLTNMYELREQIGQGKFSIVYRAIYKETGEEYAIKIIDKTRITAQERELLRSEISILKLLKHIHVIYLKDIIDMKDSLYIVMELVRGGELYDLIHTEHRLTEEHTHKIITQLLHTVAYLHKCGIMHRDLKPENLLLTDKTECATIKLTDFGLSTLCGPNDVLTQPCGTLAYVAPEVLTMQGYNQKADVWSIGVIMYLLIRGRLPFAVKKSQTSHVWDHYRLTFDGQLWHTISSSAKDLIKKLLEIDPSKRISVFEALDHIWIKNFVAVNKDTVNATNYNSSGDTDDLFLSLRNTTDTTFVIPYSESCDRNINALKSEADLANDNIAFSRDTSTKKPDLSPSGKLSTVQE